MKRVLCLLLLACSSVILLYATDKCDQRLTPEQFRAKQKAFITEEAGMSAEEAAKFFPVYFELQDRKKELNDEAWKLIRKGKKGSLSEGQYEEILEGVYDARIEGDRLDKSYFEKFKKILSFEKIYRVQKAEMKFHRELLKGMQQYRRGGSSLRNADKK